MVGCRRNVIRFSYTKWESLDYAPWWVHWSRSWIWKEAISEWWDVHRDHSIQRMDKSDLFIALFIPAAVLQSLDVSVNFTLEWLLTSVLPFFFQGKGAVDDGISPPEITTDLQLLKQFSDIGQTGRRYLWVAGQRVGCCIQRRGVDHEAVGTLFQQLVRRFCCLSCLRLWASNCFCLT